MRTCRVVPEVEAYGKPSDVLVGISTSGRSKNVIEAFSTVHAMDIKCLAMLGGDGGGLLPLADAAVLVPAWSTPRIQEVQIVILHKLCDLVEKEMNINSVETLLTMERSPMQKPTGKFPAYSRWFSFNDNRSPK